ELRARSSFQDYLVAKSGAMRLVAERAIRAAAVDANVLLTGESGVGKGLLASYIHRHGSRSKGPYIQVNCSAIPESLFESELFGYEEGAFTGARKKGKPGLLEVAHNGTMLLDEVGDMPWSIQAKLLNFLQEGGFFRVGGTKTVNVDVRIISATNADLQKRINEKLFREDLYYRLNVLPIHIPPLRERRDDIVPLALTFLNEYNQKYGQEKTLTLEAQKALYAYDWPGNVRELQNVLERIVILTEEKQIYSKHVYLAIGYTPTSAASSIQVNSLVPLPDAYQEIDRQLLQMALEQTRSMRKIAALLGISHPTVSKKIKQVFPEKVGQVIPEAGQPVSD
ncbi:MAG: sigma-54 interaction domain-containing protein, partial [Desulfotomaculales bacterium]